jgi:putative Holliday junction resolvase
VTDRIQPGLDGASDQGEEGDEDELDVVTIVDEAGNEQDFVLMDVIEVDEQEYALLVSAEDSDDPETDALVMRLEGEELAPIEDEAELNRVAARLEALANEAED